MSGNSRKGDEYNMWAQGLSTSRIEALCDGVFAIAMTILVLELPVPELGTVATGEQIGVFVEMLSTDFYTYMIGFFVLGIYWIIHHYMFHFIKRSDGVLVWLNVVLFMLASLVPFSTKVLHAYPDNYPALTFYSASTVVTLLWLLVIWLYATSGYRLVDSDINKKSISVVKKIIVISVIFYLMGIIAGPFVPLFGYFSWFAFYYIIIATAYGHHIPFLKKRI